MGFRLKIMKQWKSLFESKEKLEEGFKPNYHNVKDFIGFLKSRLIPDLHKSGKHEIAQDFEEAIYWLMK